jgi:hypothetical protein
MGRRTEAIELYRQAVQTDPDDHLAAVLLSQAERLQQLAQDRQQHAALTQRVAALVRIHAQGSPPESASDDWTSAPLTLAVLAVQRLGSPSPQAGAEEFLSYRIAQVLQDSGRLLILDQALLEALLLELQRSTADLADLQVALQVGSLLAARLITTGRMVRSGTAEVLSISLIETATGAVRARAEVSGIPGALDGMAEQVARTILQQVHQAYPLRGRIADVGPQDVLLNIGADHGVTPGLTMHVFGDAEPEVSGHHMGLIEVTAAEAQRSQARVLDHTAAVKQGWKVQEVQNP